MITRDNVSLKVSAVLYFRVLDPNRAVVVENYPFATSQNAQTTLRSVCGEAELDQAIVVDRASPHDVVAATITAPPAPLPGPVVGALSLYLTFINLFLSLLRLFGSGRDCRPSVTGRA